ARTRLDRFLDSGKSYAEQLGVNLPIPGLMKIGELLETIPAKIPPAWLYEKDPANLTQDLERCADQYQRLGQARAPLTERYGTGLWQLAEGTAASVDRAWHLAAPLLAAGDERGAGLLTHQKQLRGWAADTQKRIPGWIADVRTLEKWLAVALPLGA